MLFSMLKNDEQSSAMIEKCYSIAIKTLCYHIMLLTTVIYIESETWLQHYLPWLSTSMKSFQTILWMTLLVNIVIFYAFCGKKCCLLISRKTGFSLHPPDYLLEALVMVGGSPFGALAMWFFEMQNTENHISFQTKYLIAAKLHVEILFFLIPSICTYHILIS